MKPLETTGPRSPGMRSRVLAMLVSALTVLMGAIAFAPAAAQAAAGEIREAAITIVNDGTSNVPGDTSATDGKVAVGNRASFAWSVTVNELTDGVLTQTLPEGWSWDQQSLVTSGMQNPGGLNGYTSSFEVSPDGRTLTLHLSSSVGAAGTQIIEFRSPTAVVNRTQAAVNAVYAPELSVTDGAGTKTVPATGSPSTLTTVGAERMDLVKGGRTGGVAAEGTYDFGNGPEPALRHSFYVELQYGTGIGDLPFKWQGPMAIDDAFTLTKNGANALGSGQAITLGNKSHPGLDVKLQNVDAASGKFQVVFDSIPDAPSVWTDVNIWIPRSQVPNTTAAGSFPLVMSNTVSKPAGADWKSADGTPLSDWTNTNNTQVRNYEVKDPIDGGWGAQLWYDLVQPKNSNQAVNGYGVLPGSKFGGNVRYIPAITKPAGTDTMVPTPAKGLNLIQRWNPADAVLDPSVADEVTAFDPTTGAAKPSTEGTDYRVYYTTDAVDNASPNWVPRTGFTGDVNTVTGIRYEYIGNGGVFDPGTGPSDFSRYRWQAVPHFTVVRPLPAAGTNDLARILLTGSAQTVSPAAPGAIARDLYVRAGGAAIAKKGVVLDSSGEVQKPETVYLNAGQSVRYTITPQLTGLATGLAPDDASALTIPNVVVADCLPANTLPNTLNFDSLDTSKWKVAAITPNGCGNGNRTMVSFAYQGQAKYADPLAPITFSIGTSQVAPANSAFDNYAEIRADGIFAANGGPAASTSAIMYASQLNVARVEKATKSPVIERGSLATYDVTWFNFLSTSRGKSAFVDVLPYNGDPRGTSVHGAVTLNAASLSADGATGAKLQLTTDPAIRTGSAGTAPADGVTWIDYAQATPAEIAAATALRVSISDFVAGQKSVGTLSYSLKAPDAVNGDVLRNTVTGSLMDGATALPAGAPVDVRIQSSTITGTVWNDANGNGAREVGEQAIPGAKVELLSGDGATVLAETTSDASGGYAFPNRTSGDYLIRVDMSTLPATSGAWSNTAAPANGSNGRSGTVKVLAGSDLAGQDFGFRDNVPSLKLEKSGVAPAKIEAGQPVTWTFTVTNTGNTRLENVRISDALPGISSIGFVQWPNAAQPGVLGTGETVTATATSPLTQAQIDAGVAVNTAKAEGDSAVPSTTVSSDATARVVLPTTSGISLDKTATIGSGTDPADAVAGDTVHYSFAVKNTGSVTLSDVQVKDQLAGLSGIQFGAWPDPAKPGTLLPGQEVRATADLTLTQAHIDAGALKNEATATGTAPDGGSVSDGDSVTLPFDNRPLIDLQKTATGPQGRAAAGGTVDYAFTITNAGKSTLHDVKLSDGLAGLSAIEFGAWPDPAKPGTLLPGQQVRATAKLTLTQAHIDAGSLTNTATATGTDPAGTGVKADDSAQLGFGQAPSISLEKHGALSKDQRTIRYSFTAKNTGNVTVTGVKIEDRLPGLGSIEYAWPGKPGVLAPGETVTATAELPVTEAMLGTQVKNTATVSGKTELDAKVSAQDTALVKVPAKAAKPDLVVTGGQSLFGLAIAALLAIGAGGVLLLRRRRAEQ
ncbi:MULTISPECIES: SdrD B-like domain-containing protein [unclassified Leucobacter]|uniref:DUF7507 domain-containing protein n=1 Tax=unclassified Leucobacter TaxID=2621730 RepID=UPI00117BC533|nr:MULTISPECIES: SdrD B-like domain-containing protein [unclassified Leucobacter]